MGDLIQKEIDDEHAAHRAEKGEDDVSASLYICWWYAQKQTRARIYFSGIRITSEADGVRRMKRMRAKMRETGWRRSLRVWERLISRREEAEERRMYEAVDCRHCR
jgi:hypothetical protein